MIGLHMLVLNEEVLLPKLLRHLKPHVLEMVIVIDDRTTDRSEEIASLHGAKTFRVALNHDFAAARNFGLERMQMPWVLQVDADEWPTDELLQWLPAFLKADFSKNCDCVSFVRENLIDGKRIGCGTYEWQHRFFRKHLRFVGRIHETVGPPKGRHTLAPRGCRILHHKTGARQEEANQRYMEWPEQRAIVGA
jgi:glycosyltransferase involved in cell wall biosynthesis